MRFKFLMTFIAACSLLMAGCSAPVKTEYDREARFDGYQTFAWQMPEREGIHNPADDSAILDRRMARLVTEALEARGFQATDAESADFLVTYRTSTRQGSQRSSGVSIGMGMGSGGMAGGFRVGGGSGSAPQSVLILDVLDREQDMLVWRAWEETQQRQDRWAEDRLSRLLDRLLDEFPPEGR